MAIGTLTLGSNVDCDWMLIKNGALPDNITDIDYEPIWDEHTTFMAKFENTLRTGNLQPDGTPPTSWSIYRQKDGSDAMEFVTMVSGATATCFDYMPCNNTTYVYHSFAQTESGMSDDKTSKPITPLWDGWMLITLDETEEKGRYIPHEIFTFSLNLELSDMSNNTGFNALETFTRYPIIQRSSSNHLSGQLKGLIGVVDCATGRYYDTVEQADAIREITTDTRRKILKDLKGHVFEVELSGSIIFTIEPNIYDEPYYATIQWTEVASTENLRIVMDADEYQEAIKPGYNKHINSTWASHVHVQEDIIGLVGKLNELDSKIEAYRYELPTATPSVKGGVRVGETLSISESGILDVDGVNLSDINQDIDLVLDLGNAQK